VPDKKEEKKSSRRDDVLEAINGSGAEGRTVAVLADEVGTHPQYIRRLVGQLFENNKIDGYTANRRQGFVYFALGQMPSEEELEERFGAHEDEDEDEDEDTDEDEDDLDEDEEDDD